MSNVALVIIYNHRYEQNIPILERIYRSRFSHIFHLMPFYVGDRKNVIPVYESSYQFQGYLAQGFRSYHREDFTHYFFVADDLLLHPALNEGNFEEFIGLPPGHCYLPGLRRFAAEDLHFWIHDIKGYEWTARQPGVEVAGMLPTAEQAGQLLARHGVVPLPLRFEQLWRLPEGWRQWLARACKDPAFVVRYLSSRIRRKTYTLPYPLARGYSDILIVEAGAMRSFIQYCGIFAATGLWVEHAIPTALALATDAIVEGPSARVRGRALWTREELAELQVYEGSLKALFEGFQPDCLFLHPVKLSKWLLDIGESVEHEISAASILAHPGLRNQVEQLHCEGGDLVFHSTGNDPYLHLPRVPLDPEQECILLIDITSPVPTGAQVFYSTRQAPNYSEANSLRWSAPAGRHKRQLKLPASLNGHFRIDPGTHPGAYRIHGIKVRQ